MEHQMRTKYNIHERSYKVGDLVKVQIAKIDCGPGDHCALPFGEVLPLGPREFLELDDPSTNMTVSVIEAARLQSNAIVSNKTFLILNLGNLLKNSKTGYPDSELRRPNSKSGRFLSEYL
ncbi:23001_t:CDS:2 [Cetraspora pellucida]|uniref:23001_t:CDS:1 n=1 Tax=Cetraspora pellucida TaxID=1433469 RepID=A0A9N9C5J6_9GLOM|nr:23001_t:CDS:2 [Cetraspora pellucida]